MGETIGSLVAIAVTYAIVNNVVLSQFLGICPFLGVSKKTETAAGMGGAVIFVITIASFVTGVIYKYVGVYLPLITTNCAVLGVALNAITYEYNLLETVIYGLSIAVGFFIAIVLMAGLREKIEYNDIPKPFQGTAIVLITAALMSIAFMGFSGMKI